jgi:D-alanyl-D-alanine carboxypeptidase
MKTGAIKNTDGTYTLTVNEEEAQIIVALLGGTSYEECWDIYDAMVFLIPDEERKYDTAAVHDLELANHNDAE